LGLRICDGYGDQSLEQAEAESASTIDAQQEPFRDSVESGQTIGEATTAVQFGENDGKSAGETVTQASKELFQQSKSNGKQTLTNPGLGFPFFPNRCS
jgi:hypothetical protein